MTLSLSPSLEMPPPIHHHISRWTQLLSHSGPAYITPWQIEEADKDQIIRKFHKELKERKIFFLISFGTIEVKRICRSCIKGTLGIHTDPNIQAQLGRMMGHFSWWLFLVHLDSMMAHRIWHYGFLIW